MDMKKKDLFDAGVAIAEFKDNLSRITGDGSLVKLDLASEEDLHARCNFLESNNRTPGHFNSAAFIYFCNVLDMGVAKDYVGRKKMISNMAAELAGCLTLHNTGGVKPGLVDARMEEIFNARPELPEDKTLIWEHVRMIEGDFDRLKKVWLQKFVTEKLQNR